MAAKEVVKPEQAHEANTALQTLDPAAKGEAVMYHVGLIEKTPFEYITVPTVVLKGNVRGKCVEVPKKTGKVHMGANQILQHNEGAQIGRFEKLFKIEYDAFIKYCDTHVFRKTSEYQVRNPETKEMDTHFRADIEPLDPEMSGSVRALHDEVSVQAESLSNYVWIVPANMSQKDGKPFAGDAQLTIAELRTQGKLAPALSKA